MKLIIVTIVTIAAMAAFSAISVLLGMATRIWMSEPDWSTLKKHEKKDAISLLKPTFLKLSLKSKDRRNVLGLAWACLGTLGVLILWPSLLELVSPELVQTTYHNALEFVSYLVVFLSVCWGVCQLGFFDYGSVLMWYLVRKSQDVKI